MQKSKRLSMVFISLALGILLLPLSVWAANLLALDSLQNPGFEEPFIEYGTYQDTWSLQVAEHWERFLVDAEEPKRVRYFSSCEWRDFNSGPVCEKVEGEEAQVIWTSSSNPFDAGVYQQVSGLTMGEYYGFQVGTLQVFESTISPHHDKMSRWVGIDPYGGVDPESDKVVWSPADTRDVDWFWPSVGAQAMSTTMTVFVRFESSGEQEVQYSNTQIWIDDAFMDVAPTTTLELNTTPSKVGAGASVQVDVVWSGTPRDGFSLYAYDARYRETLTDTGWLELQIFDSGDDSPPTGTSASFTAEEGKSYTVQARTWHEEEGAARPHQVAGPWTEVLLDLTTGDFNNPGLETFDPGGVAEDWSAFSITGSPTYSSATNWAASGGTSKIKEGSDAQVWTAEEAFDAGIYQQVTGLTIGETYGFAAALAYEATSSALYQQVGLDPTGGTDPEASTVVWGPENSYADWSYSGVGAEALASTVTVFVRGRTPSTVTGGTRTVAWADDAFLGSGPTTALSLSDAEPFQVIASWSSTPDTGYTLYAYEAQYKAAGETDWTDLQRLGVGSSSLLTTSQTFPAAAGEEYTVRARTWQEKSDDIAPGPWSEETIVAKSQINGLVFDNYNTLYQGATIRVEGESTTAQSDSNGRFSLNLVPNSYALTASGSYGWQTADPISVTLSGSQPASVTLVLAPPDNVIVNGGFEGTVEGWQTTLAETDLITAGGFSGYSLMVNRSITFSQTNPIADAFKPTLTFWYKIDQGDGVSSLTAEILGDDPLTTTRSLVFTQTTTGWQHAALPLVIQSDSGTYWYTPTNYSGEIGVRFTIAFSGAQGTLGTGTFEFPGFYLDEVSLGSSPPEGWQIFLPIVLKNYTLPSPEPTPTPEPQCPLTSTRQYDLISPTGDPIDHPDYLHGDLNLSLRGYLTNTTAALSLIDYSGSPDSNAPQLPALFSDNRLPAFTSAYQVYDWDWGCSEHGCPGSLLTQWDVTLLGMQTTPEEPISIPSRSPDIYPGGYKALVLYAEEQRITLTYVREDSVANGYAVHLEGVCVDPNLLSLYQQQVKADGYRQDGYQLPGLSNGQVIGTALTDEIKVAIRDKGNFMDPRSRLDWWQGK